MIVSIFYSYIRDYFSHDLFFTRGVRSSVFHVEYHLRNPVQSERITIELILALYLQLLWKHVYRDNICYMHNVLYQLNET